MKYLLLLFLKNTCMFFLFSFCVLGTIITWDFWPFSNNAMIINFSNQMIENIEKISFLVFLGIVLPCAFEYFEKKSK